MTRKRLTPKPPPAVPMEELDNEPPKGAIPPEGADDDAEDAAAILGQVQSEGVAILLWRQNPRNMTWEYCEQVQGAGYTLEQLRQSWGAGRYRMRFRDPATGAWRGSRVFSIATGATPSAGAIVNAPMQPMPNGTRGEPSRDRMEQLLDAMLAKALQPSDTFDKIVAALGALSPVLIALVQRQGADPVATATQMATLLKDAGGKANPTELASEMLKTFREGMSLGGKLNGVGQPEQTWMDLARDYLPPILGVLQRGQTAPGSVTTPPVVVEQLPQGAAAGPGGPVAARSLPEGTPVATPVRSGFYAAFRPFVPRLVEAAREQEDPDELAYNVVGFVSGWQRTMLADAAARPDWLTEPFVQYPELEPHRLWMAAFLEAVRKQFAPEEGEAT